MTHAAMPSPEQPRRVAEQVASLAREILAPDTPVYWFGSWAEGRAVERSDIDIGIAPARPIPPEQMARLREAVECLPTLYTVDLVDLSAGGVALRDRAMARGIRL